MRVGDVCSAIIVTAEFGESLANVASRMRFNDVGGVPVIEGGRLVGVVTERDMTRAIADGIDPRQTSVDEYMTPDPETATPDMDARDAAGIMAKRGMRHMPVVEGSEVVGMLSMRDVVIELLAANVHHS